MAETTVKYRVLKAIESMPPSVTFKEVMDRIYFLYKVDRGLKKVETGDSISHEEANKRIKTWHG
ncbi:MAG: hypothetical protein GDA43_26365 [Hormoscilla sp. SP5CHS1]|nr:hypothetical protein [Hormoscilla sp. SP12CHS1]MBC6456248.1 hypothetical protein [Hormoscilla sp. SP5CHS1]